MRYNISRLALWMAACMVLVVSVAAAIAQESSADAGATAAEQWGDGTPEQVADGKHVWTDAACFNCHGSNGQGGHSPDFPRGPSLRTSDLDPDTMLEIIACGVPNTRMPAWGKGAYGEDRPCFGDEAQPVPEGTLMLGVYDAEQMHDLMEYIVQTFRKDEN